MYDTELVSPGWLVLSITVGMCHVNNNHNHNNNNNVMACVMFRP